MRSIPAEARNSRQNSSSRSIPPAGPKNCAPMVAGLPSPFAYPSRPRSPCYVHPARPPSSPRRYDEDVDDEELLEDDLLAGDPAQEWPDDEAVAPELEATEEELAALPQAAAGEEFGFRRAAAK